jgi:hypothetical protein
MPERIIAGPVPLIRPMNSIVAGRIIIYGKLKIRLILIDELNRSL